MEQIIKTLTEEIKYELFHYPVTSKKQDVKYLIKRLVVPKNTPKRDAFFWPQAMLTQALESAGEWEVLKQYYDVWIKKGLPISHLDNIMNGYSLLYVYEKTGDSVYRQAADRLYEYVLNYKNEMGSPMPYRKNHPTHVYVDGLGMIVPFLCRYGKLFEKPEAIQMGIKEVLDFVQYGMDPVSELPYHGYDIKTKEKQGIIGWGRAVGWLMLSIADSMEYITLEKEQEELWRAFWNLVKVCNNYVRQDHYFSWQLSAMEGPKDTSATAMIAYALKKALQVWEKKETGLHNLGNDNGVSFEKQSGWTKTVVEEMLEGLQKALLTSCKNGKIYDCSGECEGFSQYPQRYASYPWSVGPGTRFLLINQSETR